MDRLKGPVLSRTGFYMKRISLLGKYKVKARKLIGSTDPLHAEPGTMRGDLAVQTGRNVVHGSDSPENGKRETDLWFKLQSRIMPMDSCLYTMA